MADNILTLNTGPITAIYDEDLPADCPLPNSTANPLEAVCRFYPFPDGDPRNYYSHSKLGKPFGSAGECRGKSVSLQTTGSAKNIVSADKIPFFRGKSVAIHNVPSGSGMSVANKNGHIDFWPYEGYDLYDARVNLFSNGVELVEALKNAN